MRPPPTAPRTNRRQERALPTPEEAWPCPHRDLRLPASSLWEDRFLLLAAPRLQPFVMAAPGNECDIFPDLTFSRKPALITLGGSCSSFPEPLRSLLI